MVKKISDLPPASGSLLSDQNEASQGGVSYRVSESQRLALTKANLYDQSLDTANSVTFSQVNASFIGGTVSGVSLTDTTLSGGGTTVAQIDNTGKIERAPTISKTRNEFTGVDWNGNDAGYRVRTISTSGNFTFSFPIPDDFVSLNSISLIGWPTSSGSSGTGKDVDLTSNYGGISENVSTHSETNATSTYDFGTVDEKFEIDLSSVFSSLSAGDSCGINVDHNGIGGSVAYIFVKLSYESL